MRQLISSSAITLIAAMGLASPAMAATASHFHFNDNGSYGTAGLSQPYPGPTTTGRSYGTGVAIQASDPSQKVYLILQPYILFCLLLSWWPVFDIPCLRAGFAELTGIMNFFHAFLPA